MLRLWGQKFSCHHFVTVFREFVSHLCPLSAGFPWYEETKKQTNKNHNSRSIYSRNKICVSSHQLFLVTHNKIIYQNGRREGGPGMCVFQRMFPKDLWVQRPPSKSPRRPSFAGATPRNTILQQKALFCSAYTKDRTNNLVWEIIPCGSNILVSGTRPLLVTAEVSALAPLQDRLPDGTPVAQTSGSPAHLWMKASTFPATRVWAPNDEPHRDPVSSGLWDAAPLTLRSAVPTGVRVSGDTLVPRFFSRTS